MSDVDDVGATVRITMAGVTRKRQKPCHFGRVAQNASDRRGIGSLKPHTGFVLPGRSASPFAAAAKDRAV